MSQNLKTRRSPKDSSIQKLTKKHCGKHVTKNYYLESATLDLSFSLAYQLKVLYGKMEQSRSRKIFFFGEIISARKETAEQTGGI